MAESQLNTKFSAAMSILHPRRTFSAADFVKFRNGESGKDVPTKDAAMSSFVGGVNGSEGQAAKLRNAGFLTVGVASKGFLRHAKGENCARFTGGRDCGVLTMI